jgi:hypothetical protein
LCAPGKKNPATKAVVADGDFYGESKEYENWGEIVIPRK